MSPSLPRIAVLSSYFPTREEPYRGHSAYQTLRHMTGWAHLRAFAPMPAYPNWLKHAPKEFRYRRMDTAYQPPGMEARYFEYTVLPMVSRPCNGEVVYRTVRRAVAEFQPHLILSYWLYPDGYAAVRCGRQLGVPVIACAIGSDLRRIPDRFTRYWTRWTLTRADYTLGVSSELIEQAAALGADPARSRAILNGFDETIFYPGDRAAERARLPHLPANAEAVLYVGSLIPSKGLAELTGAFLDLAVTPRHRNLHLVCAGEGPYRATLEARAAAAGLSQRLILPGALSSSQVRNWMVASDVFCLPSYSEGCPNVVIEALACGRPVVSTRVGGIPELVNEHNGILVPTRDAASLAEALDRALTRRWDDRAICDTYRRDWRAVAADTWDVCREVIKAF